MENLIRLTVPWLLFAGAAVAAPGARELVEAGHWKRAAAALEPLLKANPKNAEALCLMSRVKSAYGEREAATKLAEQAVAIDPKSAESQTRLSHALGDQAQKASVFRQLGLARRMKKAFETAMSLDPNHIDALFTAMLYYYQAPGIVGGDKTKARQLAERIVRINPARGYLAMARLAGLEKQPGRFEVLYTKAVEADPRNYDARISLALWHVNNSKKYDLAETHAREAVAIDPGRVSGYNALAYVYGRAGRLEDLDKLLVEAERRVPDNLSPYYSAAQALINANTDMARADGYLARYLEQAPGPNQPTAERARRLLARKQQPHKQ